MYATSFVPFGVFSRSFAQIIPFLCPYIFIFIFFAHTHDVEPHVRIHSGSVCQVVRTNNNKIWNQIKIYAHLCNNNELHVSLWEKGEQFFCCVWVLKKGHIVHIKKCPLILISFNFLFLGFQSSYGLFIEFCLPFSSFFLFCVRVIWNQIKARRALERKEKPPLNFNVMARKGKISTGRCCCCY